jgi:membrane protein YqaA with SNARE-associated domain
MLPDYAGWLVGWLVGGLAGWLVGRFVATVTPKTKNKQCQNKKLLSCKADMEHILLLKLWGIHYILLLSEKTKVFFC